MKVTARHWLKYNGVWYSAGEEFEVDDFEQVKDCADPVVFESEVFPPEKKRGRPKKN